MLADIEIAQASRMRPILEVAASVALPPEDLVQRGEHIAKVRLAAVERARRSPPGKLVLVTGTTPTRLGEGKTLTCVGLGQTFWRLGVKGLVAIREPSLGPVFGTKGGAAGGGESPGLPMGGINLPLTGATLDLPAAHTPMTPS